MADALSLIDVEIRRLQDLRKMAEDPHMLELMRKFSIANGSDERRDTGTVAATKGARSGEFAPRIVARGLGLTDGTLGALSEIDGIFTIHEVSVKLREKGIHIGAAKPLVAISGVLQRLVDRGSIEVVQKGRAGLASRYRKVATQPDLPMQPQGS